MNTRIIKQIPNIFTLANLFFGACAIVFILQSGETFIKLNADQQEVIFLPEKMWFGSFFIALAAVMDFVDGFVARALKLTSEFGKQLDSLSDVVSFGVAPSMIMFQLLRVSYAHYFNGLSFNWFLLSPAFLVACFAAYRLATFNLDTRQSDNFIGLPTPAAAVFIATLPLIVWRNDWGINAYLLRPSTLYCVIAMMCYLMVSSIPFFSFKMTGYSSKKIIILAFLGISTILIVLFQWIGITLACVLYLALNIILHFFYHHNTSIINTTHKS